MVGVGKLMKQAAKMQKKMEALQEELGKREIEISAGGGAVTVKVSLQQEVLGIRMDEEFLKEEASVVEETVLEAVRSALQRSKEMSEEAMNELSQSLQIPGMPSLF